MDVVLHPWHVTAIRPHCPIVICIPSSTGFNKISGMQCRFVVAAEIKNKNMGH